MPTRRRKKIAEDATAAIEAIQDSKGGDIAVVLAAVIALGAGLAPLAPAVTSVQLAISLSSVVTVAGVGVGAEFVEDDKEVPLGADTVEGVVDNAYTGLNDSDEIRDGMTSYPDDTE